MWKHPISGFRSMLSRWFILTTIGCATAKTCAAAYYGRLAPGVSMEQAQTEMTLLARPAAYTA
jgi:hypothetical protein